MSNKKNQRGGARKGAGRKKDSGLYAESTKVVRIPISRIGDVKSFLLSTKKLIRMSLILYSHLFKSLSL